MPARALPPRIRTRGRSVGLKMICQVAFAQAPGPRASPNTRPPPTTRISKQPIPGRIPGSARRPGGESGHNRSLRTEGAFGRPARFRMRHAARQTSAGLKRWRLRLPTIWRYLSCEAHQHQDQSGHQDHLPDEEAGRAEHTHSEPSMNGVAGPSDGPAAVAPARRRKRAPLGRLPARRRRAALQFRSVAPR